MKDVVLRDLVAAACFVGFLMLGLLAGHQGSDTVRRQRRISLFLAYSLLASFAVGLKQRDLYPFTSWPLVAARFTPTATAYRVVGVSADGIEHPIDYRAWQPMSVDELYSWLAQQFRSLDMASQARAARFLLARVNESARRARAGEPPGTFGRVLGPFAAPLFLLHPAVWADSTAVPDTLVGLRLYEIRWVLEERARGSDGGERDLLYEYLEP